MQTASRATLKFALYAATALVVLEVLYALILGLGLAALGAPDLPIPDPYFSLMEVLILLIAPLMVALAASLHVCCPAETRHLSLAALAFVIILAALTSAVHMSILFLSRDPAFSRMSHVLAFEWPSVVYVLDALAWDVFFAFHVFCLAFCFGSNGNGRWVRALLILSGVLSFVGLVGAAVGDMQFRNIGILGYVGIYTGAVGLIAREMSKRLR